MESLFDDFLSAIPAAVLPSSWPSGWGMITGLPISPPSYLPFRPLSSAPAPVGVMVSVTMGPLTLQLGMILRLLHRDWDDISVTVVKAGQRLKKFVKLFALENSI